MDSAPTTYNETTDMYLQMLSEARRIEDRRLVKMILRRILDAQQKIEAAAQPCGNIVVLPTAGGGAGAALSDLPFWTKGRFWQELFQFLVFLSVGMFWVLYFFYLIASSKGV